MATHGHTETTVESLGRTLLANRLLSEEYAELGTALTSSQFLQGLVGAWVERLLEMCELPSIDSALHGWAKLKQARFLNVQGQQKAWVAWGPRRLPIYRGSAPFRWLSR